MAGLFGVGGGILIVPALVLVLGMEQRLAHGTSLAAIVPIAVGGVAGYVWSGSVDWVAVAILVGGAVLGAVAGTHALHRLPQRVLRVVFSLYLLATAVSLFLNVGSTAAQERLTVPTVAGLVLIGLAAGTIAGLLGVGGGLVMVPAMILLLSMPVAVAKGTSLAVTVPTAVVGTIRNLGVRNVDLVLAGVIGIDGDGLFVRGRPALGDDGPAALEGALRLSAGRRRSDVAVHEERATSASARGVWPGGSALRLLCLM